MPIKVTCRCGKAYTLGDSAAGKTATCKSCGAKFKVPSADAGSQLKRTPDTHKQTAPKKDAAFAANKTSRNSFREVVRFSSTEWAILGAIVVWAILGGMLTWWRVTEPETATSLLLFIVATMEAALTYRLMSCSWKRLLIPAGYFLVVIAFTVFEGGIFYLGAMFVIPLTTVWVIVLELAKGRRRRNVFLILCAIVVVSFLTCVGFDKPPVMWNAYRVLSLSSPHLTKEEQKRADILKKAKGAALQERSAAYDEAIIAIRNVRLRSLAREFFKDYFDEAGKVESCRIVVDMAKESESFKKLMSNEDMNGINLVGVSEGMRYYNKKISEILSPLSENNAKDILKEYLSAWCFGKAQESYNYKITVPAQTVYKPEGFDIGLARQTSSNEWEIKTTVQFKTKGGTLKTVPMQFTITKSQGEVRVFSVDAPE